MSHVAHRLLVTLVLATAVLTGAAEPLRLPPVLRDISPAPRIVRAADDPLSHLPERLLILSDSRLDHHGAVDHRHGGGPERRAGAVSRVEGYGERA